MIYSMRLVVNLAAMVILIHPIRYLGASVSFECEAMEHKMKPP